VRVGLRAVPAFEIRRIASYLPLEGLEREESDLLLGSGNNEGVQTVEDLLKCLKKDPNKMKEREAEGADIDFVISSTLKNMSEIPKDMAGGPCLEPFVCSTKC
jgi:hypothetical protein